MTLTQLRYLIGVVDCDLNVTAAAGRLHATQSGVSKQIKQLEDELGFRLFVRIGKCLDRVTEPGEGVVIHARAILAHVGDIRSLAVDCIDVAAEGPAVRCPRARGLLPAQDSVVES
jgi:DNA-binding transcriptional LysR family regulator